MKPQNIPNSQRDPVGGKKNEAGVVMLPCCRLYYRAMILKIAWHWQRNRHTDQ